MSDDRKDLPPVSAPNFLEKVREALSIYMGNRGDKLDRGITLRDLTDSGIVTLRPGFLTGGGRTSPIGGIGNAISGAYEPDLTPPPTPTGFMASAAISNIFIEHAAPLYPQGHGHAKTVVYGATWVSGALPVFGDAVKITEFTGTVFAHPTNPATTWHLWIKWVTVDGVESASPAGGVNGLVVTTGQDVSRLVAAMTGPGNPFKIVAAPITLADGTIVPVGTYTSDAYMASFVAARGQIGLLAVDDARIASLKVSKLEGESLKVGAFISSSNYITGSQGFRINADGLAEFSNVVVRGTVYATAGEFRGVDVKKADGTVILSSGSTLQQNMFGPGGKISAANASTYIADLAVDTLQIAGNAVTVPVAVYAGGAITLDPDSGVRLAQLVITTDGSPVLLMGSATCYDSLGYNEMWFYRDASGATPGGTASFAWRSVPNTSSSDLMSLVALSTQPAGTYTFSLVASCGGSGTSSNRTLSALMVKK